MAGLGSGVDTGLHTGVDTGLHTGVDTGLHTGVDTNHSVGGPKMNKLRFGLKSVLLMSLLAFSSCRKDNDTLCLNCEETACEIDSIQQDTCEPTGEKSATFTFSIPSCEEGYKDIKFSFLSGHEIESSQVRCKNQVTGEQIVWNNEGDSHSISPEWENDGYEFELDLTGGDGLDNRIDVTGKLDYKVPAATNLGYEPLSKEQNFVCDLEPDCDGVDLSRGTVDIDNDRSNGELMAGVDICDDVTVLQLGTIMNFPHSGSIIFRGTTVNGSQVYLAGGQYTGPKTVSLAGTGLNSFSELSSIECEFAAPNGGSIPIGSDQNGDPYQVEMSVNGVSINRHI